MGRSPIIPSTYWAKGGADIFRDKRRRVVKKSILRGEERMGKRNSKNTPKLKIQGNQQIT